MTKAELLRIARARRLAKSGEARRLRREAELTFAEMANAIGCAPSTLFRWEKGERSPRGPAAARWAEILSDLSEVTVDATA